MAVVPSLDKMPNEIMVLVYQETQRLMNWLIKEDPSKELLLIRRDEIFIRTITTIKSMVFGGVSTVPILEAAHQLGIPFRHRGHGVYQLGWSSRLHLIDRSAIDQDSAIGARVSQDKFATATFLRTAGFPAPAHILVNRVEVAVEAAEQLGWPVVVKPVNLDRSEGVRIGIQNRRSLEAAFNAAQKLSRNVLIEKEVPGTCYRLLVAGGVMRYVIRRSPPSLLADGIRTIAELVSDQEINSAGHPPWDRVKPILLDELTLDALSAYGWSPSDVPAAGTKVPLRRIESSEWRGDIEDVSSIVHPENVKLAERATQLFGLLNAGVDIITTDISLPWFETAAVINEMNFAPYFGGNAVARSKLPQFLSNLMQDQGRIPIEFFVGKDHALSNALMRQKSFQAEGIRCYLTSHSLTLDSDGRPVHMVANGLFQRALALLMDKQVDALLMVAQTAELLGTGLPVDRVDQIHVTDEPLDVDGPSIHGDPDKAKSDLLVILNRYATEQP